MICVEDCVETDAIKGQQSPTQPEQRPNAPCDSEPAGGSDAPQKQVARAYRAGELSSAASRILNWLGQSNATIRLSDLPPELAQKILDSRAETISQILEAWAESIAEQARLAREAYKEELAERDGLTRAQRHFAQILQKAINSGSVEAEQAAGLRRRVGLPPPPTEAAAADTPTSSAKASTPTRTPELMPPTSNGVRLRS